jgi:hypothetical protein
MATNIHHRKYQHPSGVEGTELERPQTYNLKQIALGM